MAGIWKGVKKLAGTPSNQLTKELLNRFDALQEYEMILNPEKYKKNAEYTLWLYNTYIAPEKDTNDEKKKLKRKCFKLIFDVFDAIEQRQFSEYDALRNRAVALSVERGDSRVYRMPSSTMDKLQELIMNMGRHLKGMIIRRADANALNRAYSNSLEILEDPQPIAKNSNGPRGAGAGGPTQGGYMRRRQTRKRRTTKKSKALRMKLKNSRKLQRR